MLDLLKLAQADTTIAVQEIMDTFKSKVNEDNLNCEYDISAGQVVELAENTWFVFDTEKGTFLDEFKKALFAKELTKETNGIVEIFIKEVMKIIERDHIDVIRDKVREILLPSSDPEVLPLEKIKIRNIEIVDYSSVPDTHKFLLKIKKEPGAQINTGKVAKKLADLREEGDNKSKTVEVVFEENKDDPEFKGVMAIEQGEKYLNDITVAIFADYSYSDKMMESAPQ